MRLLPLLLACIASVARALDWDSIPESVQELQRNLTFDINARTALFWGHSEGVVGGSGVHPGFCNMQPYICTQSAAAPPYCTADSRA